MELGAVIKAPSLLSEDSQGPAGRHFPWGLYDPARERETDLRSQTPKPRGAGPAAEGREQSGSGAMSLEGSSDSLQLSGRGAPQLSQ